jgi:hypothetical protein
MERVILYHQLKFKKKMNLKEKDLVISGATEKIDAQIEKIEKELKSDKYRYKTNCRFFFFENEGVDNGTNIKVLNISGLLKALGYLNAQYENFSQAQALVSLNIGIEPQEFSEFTWCGYNFQDWLDDISYLIHKLFYTHKLNELKKYKEDLEFLYSKDKKDEILINDILSKLNF